MNAARPLLVLALAAALFASAVPARALTGNTGGSTADFLRIGAGARALGMGEAYGAVAEGPDAAYWNPAGLAWIKRPEVSYSHVEMLDFFHHDHLSYVHPVGFLKGTVGASFTAFYQDGMDLVTNTNQVVGTYRPHSEAVMVTYASNLDVGERYDERDREYFQELWFHPNAYRPLSRGLDFWSGGLALGLSLKYLKETIHDRHSWAVAVDGGAHFRPVQFPNLAVSFVARNAGNRPRFTSRFENLPLEFDIGVSYDARWDYHRLVPAFEVGLPWYGDPFGKAGVEYSFCVGERTWTSLRAGYKTLSAADLGPLTGLTAGMGVRHRWLSLDVAFQPMAELGQVYRFTLGYRFLKGGESR